MINILPRHVANQIAAGEVVQRPSSIVKELLENSVDAGGMSITLIIKDGGQTLIQVIDNGIGMSPEDALKAFERHATSKISKASDLFDLHTFGFRGEALPSISSVSEVDMKTRRAKDSIGTQVNINGGSKPQSTAVNTPVGTNISVRNLFFNTPARRKFMKSVATENKQIISEFQRVALVNPDIEFQLVIDNKPTLKLSPGNLHQRIVGLTTKTHGSRLLSIESNTSFAQISGYVGTPPAARKQSGEQFFFVNGRYMRNPYLQKAVATGYGKLLDANQYPTFYIYLEVDPTKIDVNIHPTKSEVKFEDEHAIWQVLSSCVRQTLGKHNIVPALDFENEISIEIPTYNKEREIKSVPKSSTLPDYNPFKSYDSTAWDTAPSKGKSETQNTPRNNTTRQPLWKDDPEKAPFAEQIPEYLYSDSNAQSGSQPGRIGEQNSERIYSDPNTQSGSQHGSQLDSRLSEQNLEHLYSDSNAQSGSQPGRIGEQNSERIYSDPNTQSGLRHGSQLDSRLDSQPGRISGQNSERIYSDPNAQSGSQHGSQPDSRLSEQNLEHLYSDSNAQSGSQPDGQNSEHLYSTPGATPDQQNQVNPNRKPYDSRKENQGESEQPELPITIETSFNSLQWGGRYIITTIAEGIVIIDYPHAMQRIAYEKILANDHFTAHSQGELHPQVIELSAIDHRLITESEEELADLGFIISNMGGTTIALNAIPVELAGKVSPEEAIDAILKGLNTPGSTNRKEILAKLVTRNIGRTTPRILRPTEISNLITELLATDEPSFTPDQLPIIETINPKDIFKR